MGGSVGKLTTQGIGYACAQSLLDFGAETVVVTARDAVGVMECVQAYRVKYGDRVRGVAADISTAAGRQRALDFVRHEAGRLDVLVNNVGTNIRKPTNTYTEAEFQRLMQTNLESFFFLTQQAYPLLSDSPAAAVVNIGSVAGITAVRTGTIYAMTKAAMTQFTKNVACEWGPQG